MENERVPLAQRMRPSNFDQFVGQQHIVGEGKLLRRAIELGQLGSCIFYGPPGCGKTTLANIIANTTNAEFKKLNAVTSGVADAKEIIAQAKQDLNFFGKKTYLVLDECHRWNKAQSDCVLGAIEDGSIIFINNKKNNDKFEKLIIEDDPNAKYTMANIYRYGLLGRKRNIRKAIELYRDASVKGHELAKKCYEKLVK